MTWEPHNRANGQFLEMLRNEGAETVFRLTIPSHRLPSINTMNAAQHWQRKKIKDQERAAFDIALSSTATERGSSIRVTPPSNKSKTA